LEARERRTDRSQNRIDWVRERSSLLRRPAPSPPDLLWGAKTKRGAASSSRMIGVGGNWEGSPPVGSPPTGCRGGGCRLLRWEEVGTSGKWNRSGCNVA
jgi:hypothetical protein